MNLKFCRLNSYSRSCLDSNKRSFNTAVWTIDSWWEAAVSCRELSSVLCDDLEGWDGAGIGGMGERPKREGIYAYI